MLFVFVVWTFGHFAGICLMLSCVSFRNRVTKMGMNKFVTKTTSHINESEHFKAVCSDLVGRSVSIAYVIWASGHLA